MMMDWKVKMEWRENYDLNEHGDFFTYAVECQEGSRYVYYHGTYRNGEGQEFPDVTMEVLLVEPVQVNTDGDIVIPSAWENFWVLGHEIDTKMEYDCCEFDIEEAFGESYVYVSSDWERYLYSFTDDYKKYPPRIAPHPFLQKLGLYYFDKDVAVLVTPAGIYQCRDASLTLRGPAYRPLAKYFEIWGDILIKMLMCE